MAYHRPEECDYNINSAAPREEITKEERRTLLSRPLTIRLRMRLLLCLGLLFYMLYMIEAYLRTNDACFDSSNRRLLREPGTDPSGHKQDPSARRKRREKPSGRARGEPSSAPESCSWLDVRSWEGAPEGQDPYSLSPIFPIERTRNVIAFLTKRVKLEEFEELINMLSRLKDDDQADVVIFHEDYPMAWVMESLQLLTPRNIIYIDVNRYFYSLPTEGFDPYLMDPTWAKKTKWGYHRMCQFWFRDIFHHPCLRDVKYLMRLDDDSYIANDWPDIFEAMRDRGAVYFANEEWVDTKDTLPGTEILNPVVEDYLRQANISPRNPSLWEKAFMRDKEEIIACRLVSNNLEVTDMDFFLQPEILDFTEAIHETRGIYEYRWGDAPLRYLTLALFAEPRQILWRLKDFRDMDYCHTGFCSPPHN